MFFFPFDSRRDVDRYHVDHRGGDDSRQHPHLRRRRLHVHHQQHRRQHAAPRAAIPRRVREKRLY